MCQGGSAEFISASLTASFRILTAMAINVRDSRNRSRETSPAFGVFVSTRRIVWFSVFRMDALRYGNAARIIGTNEYLYRASPTQNAPTKMVGAFLHVLRAGGRRFCRLQACNGTL